jgi:hypothetical protein|tara:strand:- start:2937 stop:3134 length:198 start_codon:yes stop_codon:yes gene_type:complete
MDILDEFPKEDQFLGDEEATELRLIMKEVQLDRISLNTYYKRLAEFWRKQGFPEWAEEILERVKD